MNARHDQVGRDMRFKIKRKHRPPSSLLFPPKITTPLLRFCIIRQYYLPLYPPPPLFSNTCLPVQILTRDPCFSGPPPGCTNYRGG